jgi:hypothetical protein
MVRRIIMQGVKEAKSGEELLLGATAEMRKMAEELGANTAETRELEEPTAAEIEIFRKSVAEVVKAFTEEYKYYTPPYRRMLYMFLFARAEKKYPPRKILEQLKTTNRETFEYCVGKFDALLGEAPAIGQEIILAKLLKTLEPEEVEYKKEEARQNAFDAVLDALSEWSTRRISLLAKQIKNGEMSIVTAN